MKKQINNNLANIVKDNVPFLYFKESLLKNIKCLEKQLRDKNNLDPKIHSELKELKEMLRLYKLKKKATNKINLTKQQDIYNSFYKRLSD